MNPQLRPLLSFLACIVFFPMMFLAPSAAADGFGSEARLSRFLDARGRVNMDALLRAEDGSHADLRGFQVFGRTPIDLDTFERIEVLEAVRHQTRSTEQPMRMTSSSCWSDSFPLPNTNGRIHAATLYQGTLVVGGSFTIAGKSTNYIAAWTGSDWMPLGSGMNGPVASLVVHDNLLVAGGDFTLAGGTWANRIARWNGSSWSSLGQGMSGPVHDLATWNGDLVATGDFMVAGQVYANSIARWDNSAWHALDDGLNQWGEGLVVYQDSLLMVAGQFSAAGTTIAEGIASWNGSSWKALGPGPWNGSIRAMVEHQGLLIVGGDFAEIGLARVPYLAAWNGASWLQYGGAIELPVSSMHVSGSELICVFEAGPQPAPLGSILEIAAWDGSTWTSTLHDEDTDTTVPVLTEFQGQLLVGYVENDQEAGLAVFDGVEWLPLFGPGITGGVDAMIEYGGDLIIGGDFSQVGWIQAHGVARWNGNGWDSMGNGTAGSNGNASWDTNVFAMMDSLYMGGRFTFISSQGDTVRNLAKWDGSQWGPVGGGVNGEVFSAAVHQGVLYVGGLFTEAGGVSVSNVAAWNGTNWSSPGVGLPNYVFALLSYDSLLVAGSPEYCGPGSCGGNAVSAWDGITWNNLGFSPNDWSEVRALAQYNGELIIGGRLDQEGFGEFQGVARWDGATWQGLGGGLSVQGSESNLLVNALTVHNGKLIAGGTFLQAGETPAARISAWDGSSWFEIDSGIGTWTDRTSEVSCLGSWSGKLIIGGDFDIAGGAVSANLAIFGCAIPVSATLEYELRDVLDGLVTAPNPFRAETRIDFRLPTASPITIEVYDANGRRVRHLLHQQQRNPGPHAVLWDGRTDLGQPVPAGIYFYRLQTNAGIWTGKAVRMR